MSSNTHTQIWLCLRFSKLSLNSLAIEANANTAIAITENQQIWQTNTLATKFGIQEKMSINHALMLNPDIQLIEREHSQEQRKLQELSYWAYRFTSLLSQYNDHSLILEIGRSIKLFNGLAHLLHLIKNDLSGFKIEVEIGLAHTPKAAYVLSLERRQESLIDYSLTSNPDGLDANAESRQTPSNKGNTVLPDKLLRETNKRLLSTPIAQLDIDQKSIAQLHNCGFELLEDIDSRNTLPQSELGQRFGKHVLLYLDQLWGRVADPQISITPPETFESSADFAEPIRNLTWIHQQLDRLLKDLEQFVTIRQLICRSFTWRFYHENNRLLQTVTIGLSAKQNNFATYKQLSDLKLETIKLDWEFSSIQLSSNQLVPVQLFNDDLFDPKPDQQQFNQLIDKLSNRLGQHALFRVQQAPEHLPELANGRQHAVQESCAPYLENKYRPADHRRQEETPETLKDQPLWLLENPQRLPQQQRQPLYQGPLNIIHGPDRITSHWWSKIQSRDYFIARQRNGRLLWIFFDRDQRHWFLHGLFA